MESATGSDRHFPRQHEHIKPEHHGLHWPKNRMHLHMAGSLIFQRNAPETQAFQSEFKTWRSQRGTSSKQQKERSRIIACVCVLLPPRQKCADCCGREEYDKLGERYADWQGPAHNFQPPKRPNSRFAPASLRSLS